MELTREQAIKEHRKMWNWIADETQTRGYKVSKHEYLHENGYTEPLYHSCFCCEYTLRHSDGADECLICPIDWGTVTLFNSCEYDDAGYGGGLYAKWVDAESVEDAVKFARRIANLSERTDNVPGSL